MYVTNKHIIWSVLRLVGRFKQIPRNYSKLSNIHYDIEGQGGGQFVDNLKTVWKFLETIVNSCLMAIMGMELEIVSTYK